MPLKKRLIAIYFGKLPQTFALWLRSCANNLGIDWLVIGDQVHDNDFWWPSNATSKEISLGEFKTKVEAELGFNVNLDRPYKICDLRPAFGKIFEKDLVGYDFWGYCDIDTIWGKLDNFIPNEVFESNEKILARGHLCFVKNTESLNTLYQKQTTPLSYKEIFQSPKSHIFDEWKGFHQLCLDNEVSCWNTEIIADIEPSLNNLHLTRHPNYPAQIFAYSEGRVLQVYKRFECDKTHFLEFAYIHFQKRKVVIAADVDGASFVISANGIESISLDSLNYKELLARNLSWYPKPIKKGSFTQRVFRKLKRIAQ